MRRVLPDALKTLDALAEGLDLAGDLFSLLTVICQSVRIGLMPDPVADLVSLLDKDSDLGFGSLDLLAEFGNGTEPVIFEETVVSVKLDYVLQLVPQFR